MNDLPSLRDIDEWWRAERDPRCAAMDSARDAVLRHQREAVAARAIMAVRFYDPLWQEFINAALPHITELENMALTLDRGNETRGLLLTETDPQGGEYTALARVLEEAYHQAAVGKGAQRHNLTGSTPFEKQRMQSICELLGSEQGMAYQVIKKMTEGLSLPNTDRKVNELLGVINYTAGIIIYLRAQDARQQGGAPGQEL